MATFEIRQLVDYDPGKQASLAYLRERTICALRGHMRHIGIEPLDKAPAEAYAVLDDWAHTDDIADEAQAWFLRATDNQYKLFVREWRAWRRSHGRTETCPTCDGGRSIEVDDGRSMIYAARRSVTCITCGGRGVI